MSVKRFEVSFDEKRIFDIYAVNKNTTEYDIHKSCNLINSLYEENERLQIEVKELNRKYNAFYDMVNKRLSEMSFDYLIQPYKDKNMKLKEDLLFQKEMNKLFEEENKRLRKENEQLMFELDVKNH